MNYPLIALSIVCWGYVYVMIYRFIKRDKRKREEKVIRSSVPRPWKAETVGWQARLLVAVDDRVGPYARLLFFQINLTDFECMNWHLDNSVHASLCGSVVSFRFLRIPLFLFCSFAYVNTIDEFYLSRSPALLSSAVSPSRSMFTRTCAGTIGLTHWSFFNWFLCVCLCGIQELAYIIIGFVTITATKSGRHFVATLLKSAKLFSVRFVVVCVFANK